MKTPVRSCLLAAALAALPGLLQAQPDAHYVPGVEGIKCASLPPPGFYFKDYNVFYNAGQVNNPAGNAYPGTFNLNLYANVPRAIWITDKKVLGGYLGGDVVLPFVYTGLSAGKFHSSTFGIGDAYAESTLSWHPGQFDIGSAVGVWAPTGASGKPTSAGLGFWTPELTLGATWYPDTEKTWAVSALNRYEFNSEDRDNHVTPGEAWTLEYALSKEVNKTMNCAVVGYYQQRITASTGNEPLAEALYPYSRVAAVGPSLGFDFASSKLMVLVAYYYEFMADSRTQGQTVELSLVKAF
jgi:hypothetical protein